MSYILEALKKSDQQRQLGATPTLAGAPVTVVASGYPRTFYYGLLAVVLLVIGIAIGWWRPWQIATAVDVVAVLPAETARQDVQVSAPSYAETATQPMREAFVPEAQPAIPVAVTASPVRQPVSPADASGQQVISLYELPPAIQRELPEMAVQLHAYSSKPAERLVSINAIRLREGGSLMLGLRLEEITPDGMIFSYKGYRFQRGIR